MSMPSHITLALIIIQLCPFLDLEKKTSAGVRVAVLLFVFRTLVFMSTVGFICYNYYSMWSFYSAGLRFILMSNLHAISYLLLSIVPVLLMFYMPCFLPFLTTVYCLCPLCEMILKYNLKLLFNLKQVT